MSLTDSRVKKAVGFCSVSLAAPQVITCLLFLTLCHRLVGSMKGQNGLQKQFKMVMCLEGAVVLLVPG